MCSHTKSVSCQYIDTVGLVTEIVALVEQVIPPHTAEQDTVFAPPSTQ